MKKFWAKRLLEFDLGRYFGATLPQFLLLLAIFLKIQFNLNLLMSGLITIIVFFLIWLLGFILISSGFYKQYQLHIPIFKEMLKKIKEDDEEEDKK